MSLKKTLNSSRLPSKPAAWRISLKTFPPGHSPPLVFGEYRGTNQNGHQPFAGHPAARRYPARRNHVVEIHQHFAQVKNHSLYHILLRKQAGRGCSVFPPLSSGIRALSSGTTNVSLFAWPFTSLPVKCRRETRPVTNSVEPTRASRFGWQAQRDPRFGSGRIRRSWTSPLAESAVAASLCRRTPKWVVKNS